MAERVRSLLKLVCVGAGGGDCGTCLDVGKVDTGV